MKFNNKELADLSVGEATIEGRLHHKKLNGGYSHSGFKEKWFKLRANILFYFHLSETGQILDKKPVGAFILENVIVQNEINSEVPFSFSIYFNDELEKKHLFSGRTQDNVDKWVLALKQASYEYWRSQLMVLQEKLRVITGQDPLLMYPRNEGCRQVSYGGKKGLHDNRQKVQNSRSQFYLIEQDEGRNGQEEENRISVSRTFHQESKIGNGVKKTQSEDEVKMPPVRPARGNKPKAETKCGNLIDLL